MQPAITEAHEKWDYPTDSAADVAGSYTAAIVNSVPAEFSRGSIQTTPKGGRPYLGRFDENGVRFAIERIPRHEFIHVTFDLVILRSWNGSSTVWGPDIFTSRVVGGPELLSATFCNCGFFHNNNEQSYPDTFPTPPNAVPHAAWTDATEFQTLGELQKFANTVPPLVEDTSAVYHMDWTFPHEGDTLDMDFTSKVKNKALRFGFMNFKLEAIRKPIELAAEDLQADWEALDSDDPVAADNAVWQLTATPDQALGMIRRFLASPSTPLSPYGRSRMTHVLQVIHSPEALDLLKAL